jgi:hypothetical protein
MDDDLSEQIARLKKKNEKEKFEKERSNSHSWFGQTTREVMGVQKFFLHFFSALVWVWWKFGRPVAQLLYSRPLVKYPILIVLFILLAGSYSWTGLIVLFIFIMDNNYRKIWKKFAYYNDKYNVRQFSIRRAGFTVIATLVLFFCSSEIAAFSRDATMFSAFHHIDETVYLFHSTDNSFMTEGDDFSVSGCEIEPGDNVIDHCNMDNSLYFRVESNLFANVWSLLVRHTIFLPDRVQAPIAPGWNKCIITSYGVRFRLAIKTFNVYQELLSTDCQKV